MLDTAEQSAKSTSSREDSREKMQLREELQDQQVRGQEFVNVLYEQLHQAHLNSQLHNKRMD